MQCHDNIRICHSTSSIALFFGGLQRQHYLHDKVNTMRLNFSRLARAPLGDLEVELTNYFLKLYGLMWTNLMFFIMLTILTLVRPFI